MLVLPVLVLAVSLLYISNHRVQIQNRRLYADSNEAYTKVVYDPLYGAFCLSVTAPLQLYVDDSSPRYTPIEIEVFPIQQSQLLTNTPVSVTPIYTPTKITCTRTESTDIELTSNTITNTGTISYIITLTGNVSELNDAVQHEFFVRTRTGT